MIAPPRAVDALLFDFGNIIVDIDFGRVFEAWARAAGVPSAVIAQRFAFDEAYAAHETGEMDAVQYFARLRESLRASLSDDEFRAGWNAIFVAPRAGMRELLAILAAEMPLYLFSNTNALHHAYWREQYRELLRYFSRVFCSHELGVRKPSPHAFLRIAEDVGIAPSRLAFFDDTEQNVRGAREAGLPAYHVTTFAALCDALRDLRVPLRRLPGHRDTR